MLIVKILSLGTPERYAVRRMVTVAYQELLLESPHLEIQVIEVSEAVEIVKVAFTLVLPTLIINDKVVCTGRFPSTQEVTDWLRAALDKM